MYKTILLCMAVLATCVAQGKLRADDIDSSLSAKTIKNCTSSVQLYTVLADRIEESCTTVYSGAQEKGKPNSFRAQTVNQKIHRLGINIIDEQQQIFQADPKDSPWVLSCENSKYQFKLARPDEGSQWSLILWRPVESPPMPIVSTGTGMISCAIDGMAGLLASINNTDGHRLLNLSQNSPTSDLHVTYSTPFQSDKNIVHEIIIETVGTWRVREYKKTTPNGLFTEVITYGAPVDDLPFPTRKVGSVTYSVAGVSSFGYVATSTGASITRKTVADYRLSAYNLPEPEGVVWDKPTPTYVWLLAAAGVLGLLSVMFAWLKRRSTRTPSLAVPS